MITIIRTADVNGSKLPAALGWAHEIASYVKSKTGIEVKVQMPSGHGNPFRIRWIWQTESLAAHEQAMKKLMSDAKYLELGAKAMDLCWPRTFSDEYWVDM